MLGKKAAEKIIKKISRIYFKKDWHNSQENDKKEHHIKEPMQAAEEVLVDV